MLKLKQELIQILSSADHPKSIDAEAEQILFYVLRSHFPKILKISDLHLLQESGALKINTSAKNEAIRIANARSKGAILQHLLEHQYFYEHEYFVNDAVLIPRPETEILINTAVQSIQEQKTSQEKFTFAELGLGSGILSIEILAHFKNASGFASEQSPQAIAVAHQNLDKILEKNWAQRFQILEPENASIGFEVFIPHAPFDFIFSNPPYVSVKDEIEEEVLEHEPHSALFPRVPDGEQENPNFFYENFLLHAGQILAPGGLAFFEVPHERADIILNKFEQAEFSRVSLVQDLTGRPRVLVAQNKRSWQTQFYGSAQNHRRKSPSRYGKN